MCKYNKKNLQSTNVITFLNMPIDNDEDDKIGIKQHAIELKDVIDKGAKTIAITSDFGGGKSSLTKYLESLFNKYTTKFCYVNLWSDISDVDDRLSVHKSFVYQLADQISHTRGNYVSKRLSKNYGMFRISLPNSFFSFLSFIMLLLIIMGLACTTFYESITSNVINFPIHNEVGIFVFVIAAIIAVLFFFKADVVFSAKQSGIEKEIDEHELMDIYRSYICKFHWRRFIVVIEDLDRSSAKEAYDFIKEFRRYYTPDDNSLFSKTWLFRKFCRYNCFKSINKIHFIINIKSESKLQQDLGKEKKIDLFPKVFDYVLDLKEINISNYDVILDQLLKQFKEELKKENILDLKDEEIVFDCVPELKWIIRGRSVDIRTIKTRLNIAIPLFINLKRKFGEERVSLKKCLASSYITTEYADEYSKIKNIGFDYLIEEFMKNGHIDESNVQKAYKDLDISEQFAKEIAILIERKLIDYGYKIYFYNAPKNIVPYSNQENRLANIILYDEKISDKNDFELLVKEVTKTTFGISTIKESLNSVQNIISVFPKCIFSNIKLFEIAYDFSFSVVWKTIEESLSYQEDSVESTASILNEMLNDFFKKKGDIQYSESVEKICGIIDRNASPTAIIGFRKSLISKCQVKNLILLFESLFMGKNPILTSSEIKIMNDNYYLIGLVNFDSPNLQFDLIEEIHNNVLMSLKADVNETSLLENFYLKSYELFDSNKVTKYILDFSEKQKIFIPKLEQVVFRHINTNKTPEFVDSYIKIINEMVNQNISLNQDYIEHICELKITKGLSVDVCKQLQLNNKIKEFVLNASNTNINLIDFTNKIIIDTINSIDYVSAYKQLTKIPIEFIEELYVLRKEVISQEKVTVKYIPLFVYPNPIIDSESLNYIKSLNNALILIDQNQIDENNYQYISEYFSKEIRRKKDALAIMKYICSINDASLKKALFESLDFGMIKYSQIIMKNQNEIHDMLSDCYDFDSIDDIIKFMTITKCSYKPFEQIIKNKIIEGSFNEYEEQYIEYLNNLSRVNLNIVDNYLKLSNYYPLSKRMLDELFKKKCYKPYVISKILSDNAFYIEGDKFDSLEQTYFDIFLSSKYQNDIREIMSDSVQFVNLCLNKKIYIDSDSDDIRMQFAKGLQTSDSINDMFKNHRTLCIKYFSISGGFVDASAAMTFIEHYKDNPEIAKSETVYNNTYEQLVDGNLKKSMTHAHNKALKG